MNDIIRTTVDVLGSVTREIIPTGTEGAVVDAYEVPREGYAIDLAIPDATRISGYLYDNVILFPDQFVVLDQSDTSYRFEREQ